jgi:putative ABC transport system permease protein
MVLTLSFAADASTASIRDTLVAPVVVTSPDNATEQILETPGVAAVDAAIPFTVIRTDADSADLESAEGIDTTIAPQARRLEALSGDLAGLSGTNTVAISKELAGYEGYKLGSDIPVTYLDGTPGHLKVVAIVRTALEVNASMIVSQEFARTHAPKAKPDRWFVLPEPGVDTNQLIDALNTIPGAHAVPAAIWEAEQGQGVRDGNQLGLVLLLGPAALYSAIAIVNTLLMGSLQRGREFVTSRLLGATPAQIRRMVLWESTLVGAVALSLGTVITVTVGALIRHAMSEGLTDVPTTVPWATLLGIGVICLILTAGSALAPTAFILRNSHPSAATE